MSIIAVEELPNVLLKDRNPLIRCSQVIPSSYLLQVEVSLQVNLLQVIDDYPFQDFSHGTRKKQSLGFMYTITVGGWGSKIHLRF